MDDAVREPATDARAAVAYLTWPESSEHIAIMEVLESSITDLTIGEVCAALAASGHHLPAQTVETRLESLRSCGAVSFHTDTSQARRYSELLARNWRYTPSPVGRQVQRFYRSYLASTPVVREIPIQSLNLLVTNLERLAREICGQGQPTAITAAHVEAVAIVFTSHDSLDAALVGAEDTLLTLADRFDLDDERTSELKQVLVEYAKRVADALDGGSARAAAALATLAPHYDVIASTVVAASDASTLIAAGALSAARGGRVRDWEGLREWCDPSTGRAARFSLRLVHALPSMHANLRRLHSSSGTATNRTRALSLARAVLDPELGTQVFQAAVGDHPWRKLYGAADEDDAGRNPSWRGGPKVPVPELLRTRGRTGARGRGSAPRSDAVARAEIAAARERRTKEHAAAVAEVLASMPGQKLTASAARAALAALMAAARSNPSGSRRTATSDGLACTLVRVSEGTGLLATAGWRVILPGRVPVFHLPGRRPNPAQFGLLNRALAEDDAAVSMVLTRPGGMAEQRSRAGRAEGAA